MTATSKTTPAQPQPTPVELYARAGGDKNRYHQLLIEHGLIPTGAPNPMDVGWDAARSPR